MKLLLGAFLLFTVSGFAADTASGTWKIDGDVAGNAVKETCKLKQDGTKLTGTCEGANGNVETTGEVDGQKITFKHGGNYDGTALTITYSGTVAADGTLKGSIDVQPFGASGDFTAKKSE